MLRDLCIVMKGVVADFWILDAAREVQIVGALSSKD